MHLVARGWRVTVYCQTEGIAAQFEDEWQGIHRIHVPSADDSGKSSVVFDWKAISDVLNRNFDLTLTLGYNTAAFCVRLRLARITNLINMDGIEWARSKWSLAARAWFYLNDVLGCWLANHLIADHPEIRTLLLGRTHSERITVIPYGADALSGASISVEPLASLGLEPGRFVTVIARPEPENSLLEIVRAFSARRRDVKLVVLGRYVPEVVRFHAEVQAAASPDVVFAGPIYDPHVVCALRAHCLLYVHGHRVGGTNPSLVEALGAGNAVLAHDNRFNRWVARDAAAYFSSTAECERLFDELLADQQRLNPMRAAARHRHAQAFTWDGALAQYEELLYKNMPQAKRPETSPALPSESS